MSFRIKSPFAANSCDMKLDSEKKKTRSAAEFFSPARMSSIRVLSAAKSPKKTVSCGPRACSHEPRLNHGRESLHNHVAACPFKPSRFFVRPLRVLQRSYTVDLGAELVPA